jgi:cytochrome c biogenesis protein CcmG, thiol:disulfide interchange protein DsbE
MIRIPFLISIGAIGAVLIISIIVSGYFREKGAVAGFGGGPAMLAGAPAASYPVRRIDGTEDALDRYRGRVVLMNLWATWCGPCREEMPALDRLYERERGRGLMVLGIDQGESAAVAAAFAREAGVHYPILLDKDQSYGEAYAAVGLPTSVIVDRRGHIVRGIDGELTYAQMRDAVVPFL